MLYTVLNLCLCQCLSHVYPRRTLPLLLPFLSLTLSLPSLLPFLPLLFFSLVGLLVGLVVLPGQRAPPPIQSQQHSASVQAFQMAQLLSKRVEQPLPLQTLLMVVKEQSGGPTESLVSAPHGRANSQLPGR